jgi:hypothetical protein
MADSSETIGSRTINEKSQVGTVELRPDVAALVAEFAPGRTDFETEGAGDLVVPTIGVVPKLHA